MPSFSAIFCASSGWERPEKSMSRFDGPRSIQCSGLTSGLVSATSSPGRRVSSVVALSTEIALFRDLLRRETSERFGRDIFRYVRTARNPCVVPDLHRGFEAIVNAGPDVSPDLCPPLLSAGFVGVVRRDVASSHVRVLADLGVANVGEVWHFRASTDLGVLDLDERPCLGPRAELRPGTQVTERADLGAGANLGVLHDHVRSDLCAGTDPRAAAQRSEEHTSELQSPCNLVCRLLLEKKKISGCRADAGRSTGRPKHKE